jgi:hypothetical protein
VTTIVEIDPGRPGEDTDPRRTAVADLPNEVDHRLARHAIEDIPPSDALLLAIEALLEVAQLHADLHSSVLPLSALDLATFDDHLLEPLIRRGQAEGAWASAPSAASLALSLRSLIAGLLPIARSHQQEPWATARTIQTLFTEAAANAGREP